MQISIVLVRPQLPENIGMAARAMQNCGLKKLIIVSPREKFPNQKAIDASAKANNIIKNAKIVSKFKRSVWLNSVSILFQGQTTGRVPLTNPIIKWLRCIGYFLEIKLKKFDRIIKPNTDPKKKINKILINS